MNEGKGYSWKKMGLRSLGSASVWEGNFAPRKNGLLLCCWRAASYQLIPSLYVLTPFLYEYFMLLVEFGPSSLCRRVSHSVHSLGSPTPAAYRTDGTHTRQL